MFTQKRVKGHAVSTVIFDENIWNYAIAIVYLDTTRIDTLPFVSGYTRWSPDGEWFIGYDRNGYFVIKRDGSYKLYLTPGG